MENCIKFKFTSSELLVIAALLGYESVFGINNIVPTATSNSKKAIKQTVRKLERQKLLRYELDGTLFIESNLHKAIRCICEAEVVALFSTNLKSGKKSIIYVMESNGEVVYVENYSENKYLIQLSDSLTLDEIIPYEIIASKPCDLTEKMLYEEALLIRQKIENFEHNEAEQIASKVLKDQSGVATIAKTLSGNCGFMSVQIYKKNGALYNAIYNAFIAAVDNCAINVVLDENEMLYFTSVNAESFAEEIKTALQDKTKRGAC